MSFSQVSYEPVRHRLSAFAPGRSAVRPAGCGVDLPSMCRKPGVDASHLASWSCGTRRSPISAAVQPSPRRRVTGTGPQRDIGLRPDARLNPGKARVPSRSRSLGASGRSLAVMVGYLIAKMVAGGAAELPFGAPTDRPLGLSWHGHPGMTGSTRKSWSSWRPVTWDLGSGSEIIELSGKNRAASDHV